MNASDFTKLDNGPYGRRWSFVYEPANGSAPSVDQAEAILGVKLAEESMDASDERTDGLSEEVYFLAAEYSENNVATYRVQ